MSSFYVIPHLDNISESLALAQEYNFGFEYNDFFSPDVLCDPDKVKSLAKEYKSHRLPGHCTLHGAFLDVTVFSDDKEICRVSRKRVIQSMDAARIIGAEAVIFHTNHNPLLKSEGYIKNWLDRNENFWRDIIPSYPEISVYMENMFDDSPDMLSAVAEKLSDLKNFGVCFDYAHAMSFGRAVPIDEWVSKLAPYVKHLHINDNDLVHDLHLPVGSGKIDWNKFAEYFSRYFTNCTVLIETTAVADQRKSAEYLKKLGLFG